MTAPKGLRAYRGLRVLVTGGAGFIGSALSDMMLTVGAQVTVLDNLRNGKRENIAAAIEAGIRFVEGDIRDVRLVEENLAGIDVVFHLACLGVRHSIHSPVENHEVNATGTLELLGVARHVGVPRFVHVSTSEVYGHARTAPMSEEHPTNPTTVYGAAKLAGERYASAYHTTYGYPTTVIRPFNAYGPRSHHEGDSGEVIPKFMLRSMAGKLLHIHGDGNQTRDFTYVRDTARGIALAGISDDAVGCTINIGQGKEVSINELALLVTAVTGGVPASEHGIDRPGDVRRLIADTTLARELLDYAPTVELREGLQRLKAWYDSQPVSAAEALEFEETINWAPATRNTTPV